MPFPLHKAPTWLLELFRLRTLGAAPFNFSEAVQPVVEVSEMYGAPMQLTSSLPQAAAAFPLVSSFTVANPARYWGAAGEITHGAAVGTFLQLVVSYRTPTSGVAFPVAVREISDALLLNAGSAHFVGGLFPRPIVAPAGAIWTVSAVSDAAGADHVIDLRLFSEDPLRG